VLTSQSDLTRKEVEIINNYVYTLRRDFREEALITQAWCDAVCEVGRIERLGLIIHTPEATRCLIIIESAREAYRTTH
jgi:hypothetical protein